MGPAEIPTYLEIGAKRTFAGALDWPGWCRAARDEAAALEALHGAGRRYAKVLRSTGLGFEPPKDPSRFTIVERLQGDATIDFGAPSIAPKASDRGCRAAPFPLDPGRVLEVVRRRGRRRSRQDAREGPRGGERDLRKIVDHVVDAEGSHLRTVGRRVEAGREEDFADVPTWRSWSRSRPRRDTPGPRGGTRWLPRYFVRRVTWHVLDHAWEIEDRAK